jgi:hypothetical protein
MNEETVECADCGDIVCAPIFCRECACCSRCCRCDGPRNAAEDADYDCGGEPESYRRQLIDAGRGHLLR